MIEIKEPSDSYKELPGPILLLAGPGTGKTYQLAKRIKFLVEEKNINPNKISVITFTKEAARNMREKLADEDINLDKEKYPGIISTMHSLGNMIIGSYPNKLKELGLPNKYNVLINSKQKTILLQDAANLAKLDRSKWEETEDCRLKGQCEKKEQEKCQICEEYKNILRKCALVDYDDLLLLACEILKKDKDFREEWKQKTQHLLVDEYQDINKAQSELIQLLSDGQEDGLFVVGDDEQSIYSFRGGSPEFICNFEKYFPKNPKIGRLLVSWRCPEHILLGAKSMIKEFYKKAVPKPVPSFSKKIKTNNKIVFYEVPTEKAEAKIIADISKEKIKSNYSIIIIIPNIMYLPAIKEALQRYNLEYKYKFNINEEGIIRFTTLINWIKNPDDNINLRYLIDLIIENYNDLTKRVDAEKSGIVLKREKASKLIAELWRKVDPKKSLNKALFENCQKNEFLEGLKSSLNDFKKLIEEKGTRKIGLLDFLHISGLFVAPGKSPIDLTSEVSEWVNELIGSNKDSSYNPIMIYNMPSSKGLEADIIFVVGLSRELFPEPKDDIEEKSRLFYVAMTRAKEELYLFSSRTRSSKITFNKSSYQLEASPFIKAICKDHMEVKAIFPKKTKK